MHTHLEFRGDFGSRVGTEDQLPGQDVALILSAGLRASGVDVGALVEEDWGWCFWIEDQGIKVLVGGGPYAEYEDGWLCFVEPKKFSLAYWLSRKKVNLTLARMAEIMAKSVESDSRSRSLKWWSDAEGIGPTVDVKVEQ